MASSSSSRNSQAKRHEREHSFSLQVRNPSPSTKVTCFWLGCGKSIESMKYVLEHVESEHWKRGKNFCFSEGCKGKLFSSAAALHTHVIEVHEGDDNKWACSYPECDKKLQREENLRRHIKNFHTPQQCPHQICNGKMFDGTTALQKHIKIKHTEKGYKCPYEECRKEPFSAKSDLKLHIESHHKHPFQCIDGECLRRKAVFTNEQELNRHIISQHPDRVCQRPICKNQIFASWWKAKEHEKFQHTPVPCQHKDCKGQMFDGKIELGIHTKDAHSKTELKKIPKGSRSKRSYESNIPTTAGSQSIAQSSSNFSANPLDSMLNETTPTPRNVDPKIVFASGKVSAAGLEYILAQGGDYNMALLAADTYRQDPYENAEVSRSRDPRKRSNSRSSVISIRSSSSREDNANKHKKKGKEIEKKNNDKDQEEKDKKEKRKKEKERAEKKDAGTSKKNKHHS